jgi:hypothetical protein
MRRGGALVVKIRRMSPPDLADFRASGRIKVGTKRQILSTSSRAAAAANASHGPGDVFVGRTAVPILCDFGAVGDDCAMACRPPGRPLQSNFRLQSFKHRLARAHYKQTRRVPKFQRQRRLIDEGSAVWSNSRAATSDGLNFGKQNPLVNINEYCA